MNDLRVKLADFDAIIFDLGGVIINICYGKSIEALGQLVAKAGHSLPAEVAQADVFQQYEMGRITSGEFRDGVRSLLALPNVTDEQLDAAWNAMLLDIPGDRLKQLQVLGQTQRTFVLSNTNEIHMKAFGSILAEALGEPFAKLEHMVEQVYCSHWMGDRKPNPSIFATIIAEQKLNPARTLFIDDTLQHIERARTMGLQVLHLDPNQGLNFESIRWIA
ncbi:MAG: HAD-IA family hydrolase [Leptolyngbyaceae bacterium]|nr:HAD-IA family hydrolase [Leptolyngbyaceae bacterium]